MTEEKEQNKKRNRDILKWIIIGLAGFVIAVLIFGAGMFIGTMKARFSFRWAENYHQNFAGPRGGFFNNFGGRDFLESHGVFGQIIKIDGSTFVIKSRNDMEKIIVVKDSTVIKRGQKTIKISDLKINDSVVIIGQPNDSGQIEAELIRFMPALAPMPLR